MHRSLRRRGEKKEKEKKKTLEIMARNIPNLVKTNNLHILETKKTP